MEANKQFFLKYYKIWQISEKNKENFNEEVWKKFADIVTSSDIDVLYELVKITMKEIHKDQNLKRCEIEKKKASKKSFWSWGSGGDNQIQTITEDDKKQLEDFYEKNFSDDLIAMPIATIKDKRYVDLQFEISLNGGSLNLILTKDNGQIEKIVFLNYKGFNSIIKKRENNKEIKFELKEISIDALEKKNGMQFFSKSIFKKNDFIQVEANEKNFINFNYIENPLIEENKMNSDEITPDYIMDLEIGSTKIVYDPIAVKWLRKFFNIEIEDTEIVDKTMKEINKMNENYQVI